MILPFPYGLGVALAIFIVFPLFLRRRYMGGLRGGYGGSTGSGLGGMFGSNRADSDAAKYSCMRCGKVYKGRECPVCGSRATSAHF